jgi:hypothetical protein
VIPPHEERFFAKARAVFAKAITRNGCKTTAGLFKNTKVGKKSRFHLFAFRALRVLRGD